MRRDRARPATPFVGRVEEQAALRDAFEACAAGELVVALVAGEAGAGKTTLVERVTGELTSEGIAVRWGWCDDVGGTPAYWPWIQVIRALGEPAVEAARGRLGDSDEPFFAFDLIQELLREYGGPGPSVIVLDDLHAADLGTLTLLRFLVRTSVELPILVVASYRPAELRHDAARDILIARVAERARVVEVPPLGRNEVRSMLADRLPPAVLDDTASELWERSGGNALYVSQLVDAVGQGSQEELHRIPDGIRAAVRARLQPLPQRTVALLSAASVLRPPFSARVLAAMVDEPVDDVEARLDVAVDAGILAARDADLRFEHAVVREVVAQQLPAARRRRLHAAAARAIEGVAGNEAPPPAIVAAIAQHLLDAGWLVEAHEAARWAGLAADEARRLSAPAETARWLEAAADRWGAAGDLDEQGSCLEAAARARIEAGDASGALTLSESLAAFARRASSGRLLAQAALVRADVFEPSQEVDAPPLLQEALAHPEVRDHDLLRAELLSANASLLGGPGPLGRRTDEAEARRALGELEALSRRPGSDPRMRGHLAEARLYVDSGPEYHQRRRAWLGELEETIPARSSAVERLRRTYWATSLAFEEGDLREVERRLREWDLLVERVDTPYWRWRAMVARSSLAYARGRFEKAEHLAVAAPNLVANLNPQMGMRVVGGSLYSIRRDQGRLDELVGPNLDSFGVIGALVAAERGDRDDARRRLEEVAKEAEATGPDDLYWLCLMSLLAYGWAALGDGERCEGVARELAPYAGQCVMWGRSQIFGVPVAECIAIAHRGADHRDDAAQAFRAELDWAEDAGAPGFAARARIGLASVLDHDDPERAELLADGRRVAAELGMGLYVHRADRVARNEPLQELATARRLGPHPLTEPPGPLRASIRTLGRFEVGAAGTGEVARWSSRKARDALKVLVARRGRAIPREELIDLLWPEVDVSVARNRLSVVLSMVRTALDPQRLLPSDPLRADRQAVALDLSLVDVDLEHFLGSADLAVAAVDAGDPAAADLLQGASLLAEGGPFLAEDPYADWSAPVRALVERTRRDLLRAGATLAEVDDPAEAIRWWSRLVDADPDDVAAFRSLVALLDAQGRHGEATARRAEATRRLESLGFAGGD